MKCLGEKQTKSNIRYLYLDNNGNSHFLRHKLSRYKKKNLNWHYIRKVQKLKSKPVLASKIRPIFIKPPKFNISYSSVYIKE